MQLFQSWKESLLIFKPQNFKLFLLVTLKAIADTYRVWLKYWGWLFIVNIVFVGISQIGGQAQPYVQVIADYIESTILFMLFLIVRPSLRPKNYAYFMSYKSSMYFIYVGAVAVATIFVWLATWTLFNHLLLLFIPKWIALNTWFVYGMFLAYLFSFYTLFLLDGDCTTQNALASFIRSGKMIGYNLPFIMPSFIFFIILLLIIRPFINLGPVVYQNALIFLAPIPLCFLTNFYIKRLHDQFDLYFPNAKGE